MKRSLTSLSARSEDFEESNSDKSQEDHEESFLIEKDKPDEEEKDENPYDYTDNENYFCIISKKVLFFDRVMLFLITCSFILDIIAYENEYFEENLDLCTSLLWGTFILTILAAFFNFLYHEGSMHFSIKKNHYRVNIHLLNHEHLKYFLMECAILFMQPYPFLVGKRVNVFNEYYGIEIYYHFNEFMDILQVLKIYFFLRYFINQSIYRSHRAHRVSETVGAPNSLIYGLKSLIARNTFSSTIIVIAISIISMTHVFRISERPLNRYPDSIIKFDFHTYDRALYAVILTFCNVGYGPHPVTLIGRILTIMLITLGLFTISLAVLSGDTFFTLTNREENALIFLERLEQKRKLKKEAGKILNEVFHMVKVCNKSKNEEKLHDMMDSYNESLVRFRNSRFKIRSLNEKHTVNKELNIHKSTLLLKQKEAEKEILNNLTQMEERQSKIIQNLINIANKLKLEGIPKFDQYD